MRLPRSLVWFFFPPSMCFSSLKILLTDSYSTPFIPSYDMQKLEFPENQIDHFPYFSYGETWGKTNHAGLCLKLPTLVDFAGVKS